MPEIVLTKGQKGKLVGLSEQDRQAFALFCKRAKALPPGETIQFAWEPPRSPGVHAAYFSMLARVAEQQDRFPSEMLLREWAERGARHVEQVSVSGSGLDGEVVLERVKSVNYAAMDDDAFRLLFNRVKAYLLSEPALRHLWPAAKVGDAYQGMLAIIDGRTDGGAA
jgi:hypothetical protein